MTDSPYRDAADAYWSAGWRGILPIPANSKKLALKGWTGHEGRTPSYADVFAWMEGNEGDGNICLRMPADVVGIDVDDYGTKVGAATVNDFESKYGALPPTWRSTARPAGRSGIYFYRVPTGLKWPGQLGANVEIIQFAHRYAVVWPSVNPDAKAQYKWYRDLTQGGIDVIPRVDDLPELPAAWVEALTAGLTLEIEHKVAVSRGGVAKWISDNDHDGTCRQMAHAVRTTEERFRYGSRHDVLIAGTLQTLRLADGGHRGIHGALMAVRAAFELAANDSLRGSHRDDVALDGEWNRAIEGAVALIIGSNPRPIGERLTPCDCDDDGSSLVSAPYVGPLTTFIPIPEDVGPPVHSGQAASPAGARYKSRILTIDGLRNMPPIKPLIADTIEQGTLIMLAGDTGTYKSFVALDWCASIVSGYPWQGREIVRSTNALYVCGEGAHGIAKRMDSWSAARQTSADGFLLLPQSVNLGDPRQVAELAAEVAERNVGFVAFDTLNRCSTGLEENSATDMGKVLRSLETIRDAGDGVSVLVVHHSGKDGSNVRGSSALVDGMDTVYFATGGHGEPVKMERRKRKDGDEQDEHVFRLRLVDGTESGVLDPFTHADLFEGRSNADRVYEVFRSVYYPISKSVTRAELREHMMTDHRMSKSSFNYALGQLVTGKRFSVQKRGVSEIIALGSAGIPPDL